LFQKLSGNPIEKARTMNEMPTTPNPDPMADRTDFDRLRTMTDAEIERALREDPDSFIPDASWVGNVRVVLPPVKEIVDAGLRRHDGGTRTGQSQPSSFLSDCN